VGDHVAKGDMLFAIKSRDAATARSDYLECRKDLDLAQKTFAMTQELFKHEATSSISLQQAENELAKARTRAQRTLEHLRILGLEIPIGDGDVAMDACVPMKSPLDGT